jgi:hypothetical protein
MIEANNLTLIGEFSVDSGQAIIGDPCYLDEWKNWDRDVDSYESNVNKVGEYGYLGACNATSGKGFGQLGGMSAVAFSTGYGDGIYPVYANITDDGRVGLIVIDFTGEYSTEEN